MLTVRRGRGSIDRNLDETIAAQVGKLAGRALLDRGFDFQARPAR